MLHGFMYWKMSWYFKIFLSWNFFAVPRPVRGVSAIQNFYCLFSLFGLTSLFFWWLLPCCIPLEEALKFAGALPIIQQTVWMLHISFRFNGHFPGGPGLADTGMSRFWILLELRIMEVVARTGDIKRARLWSNRHHQRTNTQSFTGRMPFLSPN